MIAPHPAGVWAGGWQGQGKCADDSLCIDPDIRLADLDQAESEVGALRHQLQAILAEALVR